MKEDCNELDTLKLENEAMHLYIKELHGKLQVSNNQLQKVSTLISEMINMEI